MTFQRSSWLKVFHAPQTDLTIKTSRSEQVELWDRKQVHDGLRVEVVFIFLSRIVALAHSVFFQVLYIVGMDSSLEATSEESTTVSSFTAPFDYNNRNAIVNDFTKTYCRVRCLMC